MLVAANFSDFTAGLDFVNVILFFFLTGAVQHRHRVSKKEVKRLIAKKLHSEAKMCAKTRSPKRAK